MVFSFARIGAALAMKVADVFVQDRRMWVRLREKGGKRHEMPCHHNLETYLHGGGIAADTRADGKILSLFEPATEVIRKGKAGKPNEFGKMVKLQDAENQIVTDYEVYDRRPSDSDLLIGAVEAHQARLGRTPLGSSTRR
jgi:hypothetical protein